MKKILGFLFSNIVIKLSVFVTHFALAKKLEPEAFGLASFYFAIVQFFVPLMTLALIEGSIRVCFLEKTHLKRVNVYNSIMRTGIISVGFIFCALAFLLEVYAYFFKDNMYLSGKYILINVLASYFQFLMLLFLGGWRIVRLDKQYNILLSLCFSVYLVSSVCCIFILNLGYVSLAISSACSCLSAIYFCRKSIFWRWRKASNNKISVFFNNKFYFLNISIANFLSLGAFYVEGIILGFLSSEISVANYRMASMVISAFYFIPSSVMMALAPTLVIESKSFYYKKYVVKICLSLLVVALPIFVVLFLYSDFLFDYFFGDKYALAPEILRVLSFGVLLSFVIRVPIGNVLYLSGYSNINLIIGFFSLLFSCISVFLFVKYFGVIGAAYSFVFTLLLSSVASLCFFFFFTRGVR